MLGFLKWCIRVDFDRFRVVVVVVVGGGVAPKPLRLVWDDGVERMHQCSL